MSDSDNNPKAQLSTYGKLQCIAEQVLPIHTYQELQDELALHEDDHEMQLKLTVDAISEWYEV